MHKTISIIIPVYNGEKYIRRCIDSVLNQEGFDINSLEVLLLNDGSRDGSLKALMQYAKKYPEIIYVITHQNIGVANTRNKGIELATGKYIMFVDQDDFIDKDYCKIFYEEAEREQSDVVIGGYKRPNERQEIVYTSGSKSSKWRQYRQMSVWAKIHKTKFIKENNIEFYDGYGEDVVFSSKEYTKTNHIGQIEYTGYNWFYNEHSVSNTGQKKLDNKYNADAVALLNTLKNVFGKNITKLQYQSMIYIVPGWILNCAKQNSASSFINTTEIIFEWFKANYPQYKIWFFRPVGGGGATKEIVGLTVYIWVYRLKTLGLFANILCAGKKNNDKV